jgi:hypothetical protein
MVGTGIKALPETVTATAITVLSSKALKQLEPPGQNYSPGLVMIAVALTAVLLHRRRFAASGLTWARWQDARCPNLGSAHSSLQVTGSAGPTGWALTQSVHVLCGAHAFPGRQGDTPGFLAGRWKIMDQDALSG